VKKLLMKSPQTTSLLKIVKYLLLSLSK
jgi:hypothetical protein